jgi:Putative lumazine-binding
MQTYRSILFFFAVLCAMGKPVYAQSPSATVAPVDSAAAATAVRRVVNEAYCNGAYNALDTRRMAEGFHPDFAIFGADGDALERYAIKTWIGAIEARKAKADFDPASAVRTCQIISVDVTGDVAMVKAKILKAGQLQYTDYLSLIKFKTGWKIVAKVYAEHPMVVAK